MAKYNLQSLLQYYPGLQEALQNPMPQGARGLLHGCQAQDYVHMSRMTTAYQAWDFREYDKQMEYHYHKILLFHKITPFSSFANGTNFYQIDKKEAVL